MQPCINPISYEKPRIKRRELLLNCKRCSILFSTDVAYGVQGINRKKNLDLLYYPILKYFSEKPANKQRPRVGGTPAICIILTTHT